MTMLTWILFGLVVGVVAKLLTPGREPGGFVATIGLAMLGTVMGGWIGRAAGWHQPGDPIGFVMTLAGAILVLALYHLVARRPGRSGAVS